LLDAETLCREYRVLVDGLCALRICRVRMQRVAVATEGADLEPVVGKVGVQPLDRGVVGDDLLEADVPV
jgi:hypothetical protein